MTDWLVAHEQQEELESKKVHVIPNRWIMVEKRRNCDHIFHQKALVQVTITALVLTLHKVAYFPGT